MSALDDLPPPSALDSLPPPPQESQAPWYQNLGAGVASGAADIGKTLLYPLDKLGVTGRTPEQRAASLEQFFKENSNPKSGWFTAGDIASKVAGTLGVGPALGAGAEVAGMEPAIVNALRSGGLSLGGETTGNAATNLALRSGAGAAAGGISGAMTSPDHADLGAGIGALTPGAAWLMGVAGRGIGTAMSNTLGLSTGAGASSVQAAYQAGKSSDSSFLAHLRGDANMGDIVQQAKDALGNMRAARNADYKSGMIDVTSDRTVLDMNPIQKTLDSAPSGMFNGKVVNPDVVNKVQAIRDKVGEWASGDPEIFHTPEGMDQLKQAIGAIRETTQPGTAARTAADQVYNSVKNEIVKQAPAYAKVMSGYQEASDQLTEITKALSLGNKASADTSLRKLQSVMRNNVNTNYGNRAALVGQLEDQGGASIVPSLAGQALNSWTPRGLQGLADTGIGGAAMYLHSPTLAAALPFTSPRLVGEGSYLAGKMAGKAGGAASAIANKLPLTAEDLQRLTAQPAVVLPGSVTNAVTSR